MPAVYTATWAVELLLCVVGVRIHHVSVLVCDDIVQVIDLLSCLVVVLLQLDLLHHNAEFTLWVNSSVTSASSLAYSVMMSSPFFSRIPRNSIRFSSVNAQFSVRSKRSARQDTVVPYLFCS